MLLHDFTFFVAVCKQKSKEHERSLLVKQIDLDCLVFIDDHVAHAMNNDIEVVGFVPLRAQDGPWIKFLVLHLVNQCADDIVAE